MIRFKGQLPMYVGDGPMGDQDDFRQVPASDNGQKYDDRGGFGGFSTGAGKPFDTPSDVKMFAGYGADEADLRRGYCEPSIREAPAYDKVNYAYRSSQPRMADEDQGNADFMQDDLEFASRNRVSKGFLTRPRLPTERG